jgi:hypothetical protein
LEVQILEVQILEVQILEVQILEVQILEVQILEVQVLEVQVGVEPTHGAFAERRVPVSPLHRDWHPLMESNHRICVQSAAPYH